jgi:hypothetical protein
LLQKHPLVATATAVAAARHSPPPQPRSLRGFIVVVFFVVIVSSSALPSPPSSPPSSVIYLIVISSCPLPSIVVRSSSLFTHFITIFPFVPPSFVDCCFKRRTKPLLPTMVSLLSSWLSALVGCFRCPPPPTLAAFPWQSLSAVRCPHSWRFDVAVAVSSPCRSDTAGGPPPLRRNLRLGPTILRLLGEGQRAIAVVSAANTRLRVVVVVVIIAVVMPEIHLPSPQSRASTVPVVQRSAPRGSTS